MDDYVQKAIDVGQLRRVGFGRPNWPSTIEWQRPSLVDGEWLEEVFMRVPQPYYEICEHIPERVFKFS